MKKFISFKNLSRNQIISLINLAFDVKKKPSIYKSALKGKSVGLLFQKPSLRTKTSFYLGALQLGAEVIYYSPSEVKLGERERIADVAKTLSGYLDVLVLRTFSHEVINEFAHSASIPVVNGLSDLLHPSQVLGDLLTLYELKKDIKKVKLGYIGDGNNVCHSLLYAFSILGGKVFIATPSGFGPDKNILKDVYKLAQKSKAKVYLADSPKEAAADADALYTDVWTSMGREKEKERRKKVFKNFQINDKILKLAKKNCMVMHCLPAHRGEEIADSVLDGRNSVVFTQAENRLYSAKAILLYVLGGRK